MASMTGWTEGILLSLLFVIILAGIIVNLNTMYGKNFQLGLGTNTSQQQLKDYEKTMSEEISGGEVEFTSGEGLTLKSSWAVIKAGLGIIWNFITGGWIETICMYMQLPTAVSVIFRILYFLSLGFIILRLLFKTGTP